MPCCGQRKIYTESNPKILGDDTGGPAVEIIASVNTNGLRANQRTWVRGSHLDALLASGWLREV